MFARQPCSVRHISFVRVLAQLVVLKPLDVLLILFKACLAFSDLLHFLLPTESKLSRSNQPYVVKLS